MKKRTVSYTALNIRIHPHPEGGYVKLFKSAFNLKQMIKLRGDAYGILKYVAPIGEDPELGLEGEVVKVTKIEGKRWFNVDDLRVANEDEKKSIRIPDQFMPNSTFFSFVFYPKNHFLIIECKDQYGQLNPKSIEKFFRTLFDSKKIVDQFNKVEVTLVPQTDQLEKIFSLPQINTLELILRRPNVDDLEELEEKVLERLNRQNAIEEKIKLRAQPGLSIIADEETKSLGRIAQLNGIVKASGKDENGRTVERSTVDHPLIEVGQYYESEIYAFDFLLQMSTKIISKIRRMKRSGARNEKNTI